MDTHAIVSCYESYRIAKKSSFKWLRDTAAAGDRTLWEVLHLQPTGTDAIEDINASSLSAHQLLLLAREIRRVAAKKKEAPAGVQDVIKLLQSEIRGRRDCALWYKVGPRQGDKDSDERHEGRIDVLQSVLGHLQAAYKEQSPRKGRQAATDGPAAREMNTTASFYEHLELENTSTSFEDYQENDLYSLPASNTLPNVSPYTEDDEEVDDGQYALLVYFRECHELRNYIKALWLEYKAGRIMAQHATMLTEVAIRLLQTSLEALVEDYPPLGTLDGIAELLELAICVENGRPVEIFCHSTSISAHDSMTVKLMCIPAWTLLKLLNRYCNVKEPDDAERRTKSSEVEKHLQNGHPLGRTVLKSQSRIQRLLKGKEAEDRAMSLDTFTQELLGVCRGREKMTLWTLISCQVQMDVFDVLGEARGQVFQDIERINVREATAVGNAGDILRNNRTNLENSSTVHALNKLNDLYNQNAGFWSQSLRKTPAGNSAAAIARDLPILAGWRSWQQTQKMHQSALAICEQDNIVVGALHLYRLARQFCPDHRATWDDMEHVVESQGANKLGLRDLSVVDKPILFATKVFGMAMGVDKKEYIAVRKLTTNPMFRVPLPHPDEITRVDCAVVSTFSQCCKDLDVSNLDLLHGRSLLAALHAVGRSMVKNGGEKLDPSIIQAYEHNGALSSLQSLQVLRASLEAEKLALAFDYCGLFARCCDILQIMRTSFVEQLSPREKDLTGPLYDMVNGIMWNAARWEARGERVSPLLNGSAFVLKTRLITTAGRKGLAWAAESVTPAQKYISTDGVRRHEETPMLMIRGGEVVWE